MKIDEMIAVLQAAKAGKEIQARNLGTSEWREFGVWDFSHYDYRVKPEPREWTVNISPQGNIYNGWSETNWPKIKVREVLE